MHLGTILFFLDTVLYWLCYTVGGNRGELFGDELFPNHYMIVFHWKLKKIIVCILDTVLYCTLLCYTNCAILWEEICRGGLLGDEISPKALHYLVSLKMKLFVHTVLLRYCAKLLEEIVMNFWGWTIPKVLQVLVSLKILKKFILFFLVTLYFGRK